MPKMKSGSGAKKRFKVTGTGKILRRTRCRATTWSTSRAKRKRAFSKDYAGRQGRHAAR